MPRRSSGATRYDQSSLSSAVSLSPVSQQSWARPKSRALSVNITRRRPSSATVEVGQSRSSFNTNHQCKIKKSNKRGKRPIEDCTQDESPPIMETQSRLDRIATFIDQLPAQYKPNAQNLTELRNTVTRSIDNVIVSLLISTDTDQNQRCRLSKAIFDSSFFALSRRIYGSAYDTTSRLSFSESLTVKQRDSPILIDIFLRALIAAAVNNWILEGERSVLRPPGPDAPWYYMVLEKTLRDSKS